MAILTFAVCWNPFSFAAFFSLLVLSSLYELNKLVKISRKWIDYGTILAGLYLFLAVFLFAGGYVTYFIFYPYIIYTICLLFAELYNKSSNPLKEISASIGGQLYIAAFLSAANLLVFETNTLGVIEFKPFYVMAVFVTLWINDTGAYMIGSTLGKHRMFERISPKKSWEGFAGGLGLSVIAAIIIAPFLNISWLIAAGFALVVAIVGTLGDLTESMMKRLAGVKDAGKLLPGHGGILDRIDGAIPAMPVAYMYIELFIRS